MCVIWLSKEATPEVQNRNYDCIGVKDMMQKAWQYPLSVSLDVAME